MMREALDSLISAIENGRTDIVRSIVSACERCEVEDEGDITVDQLLNSHSTFVGTVLHLATKMGDADAVRTLLSAGADPGIHNKEGQTALDLATHANVCDVFSQELLQCIAQSNIGRVCQLLAAGVSVNLIDCPDSANTPLHWAACYANADMVQCLIKRKAYVNAVNTDGATPLHEAISRPDMDIVAELLEAGAATNITPHRGKYNGRTVEDLAADLPELAVVMEKYKHVPQVNGLPEDEAYSKLDDEVLVQRSLSENSTPPEHANDSAPPTPKSPKPDVPLITLTPEKIPIVSQADGAAAEKEDLLPGLNLLWPRPQRLTHHEGPPFQPASSMRIYLAPSLRRGTTHLMLSMWQQKRDELKEMEIDIDVQPLLQGQPQETEAKVVCEINERLFDNQQAYRVSVTQSQVKLVSASEAGMYYGINTLLQLLRLCHEGIPQLQIYDWPNVRDRGVLLDLSKGRIPKLESIINMIKTLASLKVNQIHLYMRFKVTQDNESQWQLPYSQSSLLEINSLCLAHQVELVPVLDVAPSVDYLDLVGMRYNFLHFVQSCPSASVVGVGPRLTSLLVDTAEEGAISMDELNSLIPLSAGQVVQLCAYVFHDAPGLLRQLPVGTMLTEYGFEATYDFEKHCKLYDSFGVTFSLMAGTAAWNSLAGCPEAAVANVSAAVAAAVQQRALAVVTAHWAGVGHMTHQPISWPGFLTAAGLSWNSSVSKEFIHSSLAQLLNEHVFADAAGVMGQVIVELGRAETYVLRCSRKQQGTDHSNMPSEKGSTLYQLLSHPDQVPLENLTHEVFQRTMRHVRKCVSELGGARPGCAEHDLDVSEVKITGDLMLSACRVGRALVHIGRNPAVGHAGFAVINLGVANLSATQKTDLANRLLPQLDTYRAAWLQRSLPEGLAESLGVLSVMLRQFIPQGHSGEGDGQLPTAL